MISKILLNVLATECLNLSLLGSFNNLLDEGCASIEPACLIVGVLDNEARVTTYIVYIYIVCENCLRALTDPSLDHGQTVQSSAGAAFQGGERLGTHSILSVAHFGSLGQQTQCNEAQQGEF